MKTNVALSKKISVIIPVYNSEKYLKDCLDSVINQTYKNLEIICVDDGSTDSSRKILKDYSKKDKRISLYFQKNLGGNYALNNGIKYSTGEFIHFLDSDDYLVRDCYEILLNKFNKNSNCDLCIFSFFIYNIKKNNIYSTYKFWDKDITTTFLDNPWKLINLSTAQWSKMYKTDFIKKNNIQFDKTFFGYDVLFYLNCLKCSNNINIITNNLIYYRIGNEESNSGSLIRSREYATHFICFENCIKLLNNEPYKIREINFERQFTILCYYFNLSSSIYRLKNFNLLKNFILNFDNESNKIIKNNIQMYKCYLTIIKFNPKKKDINKLFFYCTAKRDTLVYCFIYKNIIFNIKNTISRIINKVKNKFKILKRL